MVATQVKIKIKQPEKAILPNQPSQFQVRSQDFGKLDS